MYLEKASRFFKWHGLIGWTFKLFFKLIRQYLQGNIFQLYYLPDDYIIVDGAKNCKLELHKGLIIIAYRTHGKKFYNSDEYILRSYDDTNLVLIDSDNDTEFNNWYKTNQSL